MDEGIWDGDAQLDYIVDIVDMCDLEYDDYLRDKQILTQELLEENLKDLISSYDPKDDIIGLQVIGVLILQTGSTLPENLKKNLIWAIDQEIDNLTNDFSWYEIRKIYLNDFREKLIKHKRNTKSFLLSLKKIENDSDLNYSCIGLSQFKNYINSNKKLEIKYLNLDSCQLTEISDEIYEFKSIETLSLDHNQINSLPDSINTFKKLKGLYLKDNEISKISDNLGKLNHLEELNLSENKINSLPDSIINLKNLRSLYLSGNQLQTIPEQLGNINSLKSIDLSHNPLKVIPENIVPYSDQLFSGKYRSQASLN